MEHSFESDELESFNNLKSQITDRDFNQMTQRTTQTLQTLKNVASVNSLSSKDGLSTTQDKEWRNGQTMDLKELLPQPSQSLLQNQNIHIEENVHQSNVRGSNNVGSMSQGVSEWNQVLNMFQGESHKQLKNCRQLLKAQMKIGGGSQLAQREFRDKVNGLLENAEKYEQLLLSTIQSFKQEEDRINKAFEQQTESLRTQKQISEDLQVLSSKQESLLQRLKDDVQKKTQMIQRYEKIITKNEQNLENQLNQIKNQSLNQDLQHDTFTIQLKQLETQNQLLKDQVKLEEEKQVRFKQQIYELQTKCDTYESDTQQLKGKLEEVDRENVGLKEECEQLQESLHVMNLQMDKVEEKIAQKCKKIEGKLQAKIEEQKREIQKLREQMAGVGYGQGVQGDENDMQELMEIENEIKQIQ